MMENCDHKCVGCHFFETDTPHSNKESAREDFREAINKNDSELIIKLLNERSYIYARCFKGIWPYMSYLTDRIINNETIAKLTQDRKDLCSFFYRYSEGMKMDTALELLKKDVENKKVIDDTEKTITGLSIQRWILIVAALSLLIGLGNIVVGIMNYNKTSAMPASSAVSPSPVASTSPTIKPTPKVSSY